jgi:hypothetical protein
MLNGVADDSQMHSNMPRQIYQLRLIKANTFQHELLLADDTNLKILRNQPNTKKNTYMAYPFL